jgi:hypothetical protein
MIMIRVRHPAAPVVTAMARFVEPIGLVTAKPLIALRICHPAASSATARIFVVVVFTISASRCHVILLLVLSITARTLGGSMTFEKCSLEISLHPERFERSERWVFTI